MWRLAVEGDGSMQRCTVAVCGSDAGNGKHLEKSLQGSCSQNPLKYRPSLPLIRLIVSSLRDWHWSWAEGNDINATHKADTAPQSAQRAGRSGQGQIAHAHDISGRASIRAIISRSSATTPSALPSRAL